jgi:nifR3 family TIM-barrel protein
VKTRLGWDDQTKNVVEVAERLQDIGIQALTIHGRTRVQMYKGSADWSLIGKIKENPRISIPVFGNGDIDSPQKALEYKNRYGVDGIMIGRAAIGYPWIFAEIKHFLKHGVRPAPPTMAERVRTAKKHLDFSVRWKGDRIGIFEMRRHYTNYFKGIPDFKPFRARLVEADSHGDVIAILDEVIEAYSAERAAA